MIKRWYARIAILIFLRYSLDNIIWLKNTKARREITDDVDIAIGFAIFQSIVLIGSVTWPVSIPAIIISEKLSTKPSQRQEP